ncbi:MAG: DUF4173 domain-containing protein [Clostridia bacterium]|jgi:hypothetical protein|nr:DUF4173 domain-containing protein [Clostridia bacterium]
MINIFISALIFSIWGVMLFFGKKIGLSMLLFTLPFTYYLISKLEKSEKIVNEKAKVLLLPITLLSMTYLIYNNKFFSAVNICAIILLISYMIYRLFNENVKFNFTLIKKTIGIFFKPFSYAEQSLNKLADSFQEKRKNRSKKDNTEKMKKVAKAIGITFPIVLVVIILLASADEVFGSIFMDLEDFVFKIVSEIKITEVIARIMLILFVCVYLIMFFYNIFVKYKAQEETSGKIKIKKDNFTIRVILGTLNIVYLIFCIIQVKSLFMQKVDINYAGYARQGFFQLMIVSVINLITILIAKKSENEDEKGINRYINIMCVIMIIFTMVILVSSGVRMYYYESAYGYTFLRLLVYSVLVVEAVLLVPTVAYVLNAKINLTKIYFMVIIVAYICMNFANFDLLIVRRNLERYTKTGKIDVDYIMMKTGTDAVPEIARLLEIMPDNELDRERLSKYMKKLYKELEKENIDIRDFNLSKAQAKKTIKQKIPM